MRKITFHAMVAIMALFALISVGQGTKNALQISQDFSARWLSARLILARENPYRAQISGVVSERAQKIIREDRRLMFSNPSFPSSLLFMVPYALMPYSSASIFWLITNLLAAFWLLYVAFWYYKKQSELSWPAVFFITAFFLCSTPFRVGLGNGQASVIALALFFTAMFLCEKNHKKTACFFLALSMVKYAFVIPFLIVFVVKKQWKIVAGCIFAHVLLHMATSYWMRASAISVFLDALKIGGQHLSVRDVSAHSNMHALQFPLISMLAVDGIIAIFFIAVSLRAVEEKEYPFDLLGLATVFGLVASYHRIYDYVGLLFCLLWALMIRRQNKIFFFITMGNCIYFFLLQRVLSAVLNSSAFEKNIPWVDAAIFYPLFFSACWLFLKSFKTGRPSFENA